MTQLALEPGVCGDRKSDHLDLVRRLESQAWNGKTFAQRATGRFYTHELIGRYLAAETAEVLSARSRRMARSVADPFCGDGRLVNWLLEATQNKPAAREPWSVEVWDCDEEAVTRAVGAIEATARRLGRTVAVRSRRQDTFVEAAELRGVFDVVITNPPWEQVKPDRRELALLDDDAQRRYLGSLKDWSAFLATTYSAARPRQHFAGWGMNLSRAGTDVAMRLTAQDGLCAVVSPASFLADTNSEELRRALFARMSLRAVGYFPAEARLFEDVDVPCIAFVAHARRSKTVQTFVSHFSREHSRVERRSVRLDADSLRKGGWVVPVAFGAAGIELLAAFDDLPAFDALESTGNLWAGRELDETRKERYLKPVGNHPFAKGVNIRRFGIAAIPTVYVNEAVVRLPASVNHPRLAWRDVSRPSQKRRVHATLIPAGWVTGNSLGVAYRKDDDLKRLAALLGIFNSLTWEYQLRARLSTGHISLSSVRLVRLPRLTPLDEVHLAELAIQALEGIDQAETRLEVEVARAYGLDASAWDCILDSYPKLTSSERDALVAAWAT